MSDTSPTTIPTEGFCLECSHPLPMVADGKYCPQCLLQFDPLRPETYSPTPWASRWKFWLPGFVAAVASGVISYALCLLGGEMGWALFVAVPISYGTILGYGTRMQTWLVTVALVVGVASMVVMLISLNLAGFFCGGMLALIFLIPATFGLIIGITLRMVLMASGWDHRWYFRWFVWGFALLPIGVQGIELALPGRLPVKEVRTDLHVNATPEEAWNAIMFYEEVQHDPPWLLHLALPKPIRKEGDMQREGEVVRCFYDGGYLAKRISRIVPGERMDFEVVEQTTGAERNVTLIGGSFEIEPTADGEARVVLTTRYQPKLNPRWMWEGTERKVIHTLHGHVLEGMRRKAEGLESPPKPKEYQPPAAQPNRPPLATLGSGMSEASR